eukprot:SM000022S07181  [mRNA]  locus=s22:320756:322460:- [translate_table: standard]
MLDHNPKPHLSSPLRCNCGSLGLSSAPRLLAFCPDKLQKLAEQVISEVQGQAYAIEIDATNPAAVKQAFEAVRSLGSVQVLVGTHLICSHSASMRFLRPTLCMSVVLEATQVYNANAPFPQPKPKFTDIPPERFESALKALCLGAFYCAQEVLPVMEAAKKGTIIFTGATGSLRGGAGLSELACGKFALRGLAQSLAREYQPQGIHVSHVIIDGAMNTPRAKEYLANFDEEKLLSPDAVAEAYWQLHQQHRSAWTQELDLRPYTETF